jgi:hypothetical protein
VSGEAGWGEAGAGEAGIDPLSADISPPAARPPHALFFDPAIMDFPKDDAGRYVEIHPVDQKVELQLALALGSSASAPGVGGTLREIQIASREAMTDDATQRVNVALADLIAAGDVILVSVVAYASNPWRAHIEVVYKNRRAPDRDRNRTSVIN